MSLVSVFCVLGVIDSSCLVLPDNGVWVELELKDNLGMSSEKSWPSTP
jgi:hypothetical protein